MGLKGILIEAAINTTIRTIALQAEKEESKPTVANKKGEKSPAYSLASSTKSYCVVMEHDVFSMYSLKEYTGKERLKYCDYIGNYKVFDKNGLLKYVCLEEQTTLGEEIIGKDLDKLFLFNLNGEVLGRVKEHVISLHAPIIEHNAKTCTILVGNDKLCDVRRCYSVGKECFEINGGRFVLKTVKNKEFEIKKGSKRVAKFTILRANLRKRFSRCVVIEYDDVKYETSAILLGMAFDTVCSY